VDSGVRTGTNDVRRRGNHREAQHDTLGRGVSQPYTVVQTVFAFRCHCQTLGAPLKSSGGIGRFGKTFEYSAKNIGRIWDNDSGLLKSGARALDLPVFPRRELQPRDAPSLAVAALLSQPVAHGRIEDEHHCMVSETLGERMGAKSMWAVAAGRRGEQRSRLGGTGIFGGLQSSAQEEEEGLDLSH
jgi:hypothetical protein